jgi:hypothetical protein
MDIDGSCVRSTAPVTGSLPLLATVARDAVQIGLILLPVHDLGAYVRGHSTLVDLLLTTLEPRQRESLCIAATRLYCIGCVTSQWLGPL